MGKNETAFRDAMRARIGPYPIKGTKHDRQAWFAKALGYAEWDIRDEAREFQYAIDKAIAEALKDRQP